MATSVDVLGGLRADLAAMEAMVARQRRVVGLAADAHDAAARAQVPVEIAQWGGGVVLLLDAEVPLADLLGGFVVERLEDVPDDDVDAQPVLIEEDEGPLCDVAHDIAMDSLRAAIAEAPPEFLSPVSPPAVPVQAAVEPAAGVSGDRPGGSEPVPDVAASGLPARWTEAEDARAIEVAVGLLAERHHGSRELAAVIAPMLGRPVEGTSYRLRTKLAEPIAARLKERLAAAKQPDPDPAPQAWDHDPRPAAPEVVAEPVVAPAPKVFGSAFAAAPQDDLTAHLLGLKRDTVWTWERDAEFCELLGLGQGWDQIAGELGIDAKLVKARFDLLTGLRRDTGVRSFIRSAVLARMAHLDGLRAAASEDEAA